MDYNNGKIYALRNSINDEIYVGSTTQRLSKRLYKHKSDMKTRKSKLYDFMNSIGAEHFYIELVENYPCNSKEELERREGQIIRQIATLNQKVAGRTNQEFQIENPEHNKAKYQKYWDKNHEKELNRCREYRENNREKERGRNKKYVEQNSYTYTCPVCNYDIKKYIKRQHEKTKTHQQNLMKIHDDENTPSSSSVSSAKLNS